MDRTFTPARKEGTVRVPGSKSQTIRSYLIAFAAEGISTISGALESRDTLACKHLLEQTGTLFSKSGESGILTIDSRRRALSDGVTLDCGNSGTTMYLATGLLASLGVRVRITGDEQILRRPVGPLLASYEALGAEVSRSEHPPFTIRGPLWGGHCSISCPTSQYLSSLLLALPLARGDSAIDVPLLFEKPYVSLTLAWLDEQGIDYEIDEEMTRVRVRGGQRYRSFSASIDGDYSSASFFFAMAALSASTITVEGLSPTDKQGDRRILEVLKAMGCSVSYGKTSVSVTGPKVLRGGTFDLNDIPDALPVLSAVATMAGEDVRLTNVSQARIKETDRIACMREELSKLGARVTEREDGLTIESGHPLRGATLDGHGDHRIIMALATLSTVVPGETTIRGVDAVDVTFPTFFDLFDSLGGKK